MHAKKQKKKEISLHCRKTRNLGQQGRSYEYFTQSCFHCHVRLEYALLKEKKINCHPKWRDVTVTNIIKNKNIDAFCNERTNNLKSQQIRNVRSVCGNLQSFATGKQRSVAKKIVLELNLRRKPFYLHNNVFILCNSCERRRKVNIEICVPLKTYSNSERWTDWTPDFSLASRPNWY